MPAPMLIRTCLVLLASALLASCGVAQCTALCLPSAKLTLVNGTGGAVAPGLGSITVGTRTEAFDCTQGTSGAQPDGGMLFFVRCEGNKLVLDSLESRASKLTLSVAEASGTRSFSGDVTLNFSDTGREVCGTRCAEAAETVTLQ